MVVTWSQGRMCFQEKQEVSMSSASIDRVRMRMES